MITRIYYNQGKHSPEEYNPVLLVRRLSPFALYLIDASPIYFSFRLTAVFPET